ncbi:MAG: helix-turn-helix domain-containing protein [Colwelliaceae bacterium]|nr:helix-turn-helix domain-containing protein [Colwelliaceae bacterium]
MSKSSQELPEDIEVVGPGQMLAEAREALKLSQQDVAKKLNFRITLVDEIEHEIFDNSLPDTFNRGYLKNYAKLVGISEQDIIASYEMLGVAVKQRTEMQSFSKITEKQAMNTRLMWITYLILAALVTSTLVYYIQDARSNGVSSLLDDIAERTNQAVETVKENGVTDADGEALETADTPVTLGVNDDASSTEISTETDVSESTVALSSAPEELEATAQTSEADLLPSNADVQTEASEPEPVLSKATFTFAGDCWVNIYDGDGERIAWGIKKAGYVMELTGKAPFKVTVGKPELVTIDFNGETIDMSGYNIGNIAKFTLPKST